jgi:hypothetical protein
VLFVVGGAALTAVAVALLRAGLSGLFAMIGVMFVFAPPAMVTLGIAMVISPGEGREDLELSDWLDYMPLRRRMFFYGAGAIGLAIGAVLLLAMGDWSLEGVIDILL